MNRYIVCVLGLFCLMGCSKEKPTSKMQEQAKVENEALAKLKAIGTTKEAKPTEKPAEPASAGATSAPAAGAAAVVGHGKRTYFLKNRGWDKVPAYLDESAHAFIPEFNKKEQPIHPTLNVDVKSATALLIVLATPELDGVAVSENAKLTKEKLQSDGWTPVGTLLGMDNHTATILRKKFDGATSFTLPSIAPDEQPVCVVVPTGASVAAIDALPPVVMLASVVDGTSTPAGAGPAAGPSGVQITPPGGLRGADGQPAISLGSIRQGKGKEGRDDESAPPPESAVGPGVPIGGRPGFGQRPRPMTPEQIIASKLAGVKCFVTGQAVSPEISATYLKGKVFFATEEARGKFEGDRDKFGGPANYQLFATGQAVQTKCPITGRPYDSAFGSSMGGHEVYFANEASLNKVERAQANARYMLVFKNTAFKKAFEVHPENLASLAPAAGSRISDAEAAQRAQTLSRLLGKMLAAEDFGERLAGAISSRTPLGDESGAGPPPFGGGNLNGGLKLGQPLGAPSPGAAPPAGSPPPSGLGLGGKGKNDRD